MDHAEAAWGALLRAHASLVGRIGEDLERETGLPLTWYDVLLELKSAPEGGLRMSDLGDRVVLSRSRVSRVVDELLADGFVRRVRDPEDGRAWFAVITPRGRERQRRVARIYLRLIDRHFGRGFTKAELQTLRSLLDRAARSG